ncbi:HAD family phosphatase [Paracoccus liaowanqingii]|uniref:HAD family phosphatase n=1 Tax=Paracoccus liaowanqingii TaxID=2560053 RepID=A0A4P7HNK5_9RHOB|nr:HAD family phosphatase [Paracoccus liaowanqingii]QBX35283.1 HAD family phosphatase [Paracoccus liaowanqingii]
MITTLVFDIGNVLIRWDPVAPFLPHLGDRDSVQAFLDRVWFRALNLRADGGESFADLATEIADPDDRALFAAYLPGYAASITDPIEGTWALMDRLRARGHAIHAITNWSAQTWPLGLATHPRLATAFGTTIVSGIEGVIKPDPRIFALLCDRAGVAPEDCLFIDDSAYNIAGALASGMAAHRFTDPETLERDLTARGLL